MAKKKKRIIHLIEALNRGGCENFLLRVLPRMSDSLEQRILTLGRKGELAKDFEAAGIRVDRAGWGNVLKKIREFDPEVVVTYLFRADVVGRLLVRVLTKYKVIPFLRTNYNYSRYWLPKLFERLTSFMVSSYLVNSNSVKNYLMGLGVDEKRIKVITNGLDIKVFSEVKKRRASVRQSLGVGRDEVVICCVANFHPNKGHVYLLKAFEKVYEKHNNIRLLLVGDGEERQKMEELVANFKSKEQIKFLGRRDDVELVLAASDVFVLATFFEGMSNALLEAMASGLAIVTTAIAENKELLTNEKNALLVKPGRVGKISEALTRLVKSKSLRAGLGKAAFGEVKQRFDIKVVAERLSTLFEMDRSL